MTQGTVSFSVRFVFLIYWDFEIRLVFKKQHKTLVSNSGGKLPFGDYSKQDSIWLDF